MDRRAFLRAVAAVPLAPVVSRRINLYPEVVPRLAFHPLAFALVMAPLQIGDTVHVRVPQRFALAGRAFEVRGTGLWEVPLQPDPVPVRAFDAWVRVEDKEA